jgi:hypothetical protein
MSGFASYAANASFEEEQAGFGDTQVIDDCTDIEHKYDKSRMTFNEALDALRAMYRAETDEADRQVISESAARIKLWEQDNQYAARQDAKRDWMFEH